MPKRLPKLFIVALTLAVLLAPRLAKAVLEWTEEGVIFPDSSIANVEVSPAKNGEYRMYFQQDNQIKSAISKNGRKFTAEAGTRLKGDMPTVITLPDGRLRMYFQTQEEGQNVIKSVVSKDGLSWTVENGICLSPGGEYDPDSVGQPAVVALTDGGYRMYYDGEIRKTEEDFISRILSATSTDGLAWTKDPGVRINVNEAPLNADRVWGADVAFDAKSKTFTLYFSARTFQDGAVKSTTYEAQSKDGLTFTISDSPILSGSAQNPAVLEFPQGTRIYYEVAGSGVYSAIKKEAPQTQTSERQNQSALEKWFKDRLGIDLSSVKETLSKIKIPAIRLPNLPQLERPELFIVPTIFLAVGGSILLVLWKNRH